MMIIKMIESPSIDEPKYHKFRAIFRDQYSLGMKLMLKPETKLSGLYILGELYKNGYYLPRDFNKYIAMFYEAAELGHAGAALDLSLLYSGGQTDPYVGCDLNKALFIIDLVLDNPNDRYSEEGIYDMLIGIRQDIEVRLLGNKPDNM